MCTGVRSEWGKPRVGVDLLQCGTATQEVRHPESGRQVKLESGGDTQAAAHAGLSNAGLSRGRVP